MNRCAFFDVSVGDDKLENVSPCDVKMELDANLELRLVSTTSFLPPSDDASAERRKQKAAAARRRRRKALSRRQQQSPRSVVRK